MLDVRRSPELQAALLAMRQTDREITANINKTARTKLGPIWQESLRGNSTTRLDIRALVKGARVAVGVRQVSLKAATSTKALSGGLVPTHNWQAQEFGMRVRKRTFTTHSPKGKAYKVTRTQGTQFPARTKHGRVIFAAASETGTRLVGIWLVHIVDQLRTFADIKGGR